MLSESASKVVLRQRCSKICSKFAGEPPCRSAISMKLQHPEGAICITEVNLKNFQNISNILQNLSKFLKILCALFFK